MFPSTYAPRSMVDYAILLAVKAFGKATSLIGFTTTTNTGLGVGAGTSG